MGEWESEQAREWASKQAGQWASGPGKGGKRGEQGERQQFFFSVQHHPNFYDFESNLGVFSGPPGPLILDQDGPCGLQIFPNTPPLVKGNRIDLLLQSKSQIIMF